MRNATRILIVLDRSGSMELARKSTISGLNEFISMQKQNKGDISLKLIQFDSDSANNLSYEVTLDKPIQDIKPLTVEDFQPRGGTPLLDAQGKTITELGKELANLPEWARPDKVIVVAITDGYENTSKKYSNHKIREMIKHQTEKYNWDFVYLGANQDAVAVGQSMGYSGSKSMSYSVCDPAAVANTYANLGQYATRAVAAGSAGLASNQFEDEERSSSLTGK